MRLREVLGSKRARWISVLVVVVVGVVAWFWFSREDGKRAIYAEVQEGHFTVSVKVTGELEAVRSEKIEAPADRMQSRWLRLSNVTIKDLVPEGTIVDSGDFVALLDKEVLSNQIKVTEDDVDKMQQQYLKVQLDTTLQLRTLSNSLLNMKFDVEEKELILEQSKYEPPATIRQAQINLDKAKRAYIQAQNDYELRRKQYKANMREAALNLQTELRKREEMRGLLKLFTIRAPRRGMVVYYKQWGNEKRTVGSMISPWDVTIATLPDLSEMNSKTYVSEVDVSRIRRGQEVRIGVDAFPDRVYAGVVTQVANIGEQSRTSDSRVFEVMIRLNQVDSLIRPSMTTSNEIIISQYDSVQFCPLECIYANDTVMYVYTVSGQRHQVEVGAKNDTHAVVRGLLTGEKLYLSQPEGAERFRWVPLSAAEK